MTIEEEIYHHNDEFGAVLNCAVRYSLGRQGYMTYLIIDYITTHFPDISDRTLHLLDQDIMERKYFGAYSEPFADETLWTQFLKKIHDELKRRGSEPHCVRKKISIDEKIGFENNVPLSLEELDKMDGQPVWITPGGFWALVYAREGQRTILVSNDRDAVYADKEISLVGPVYRRPPND